MNATCKALWTAFAHEVCYSSEDIHGLWFYRFYAWHCPGLVRRNTDNFHRLSVRWHVIAGLTKTDRLPHTTLCRTPNLLPGMSREDQQGFSRPLSVCVCVCVCAHSGPHLLLWCSFWRRLRKRSYRGRQGKSCISDHLQRQTSSLFLSVSIEVPLTRKVHLSLISNLSSISFFYFVFSAASASYQWHVPQWAGRCISWRTHQSQHRPPASWSRLHLLWWLPPPLSAACQSPTPDSPEKGEIYLISDL